MYSDADFESHKCDISIKGCQIIEVTEFYDGSFKEQKIMNGMGTDGILYSFEVVTRKAIPIMEPLSRRIFTTPDEKKRTDIDFTEPFITNFIYLYD